MSAPIPKFDDFYKLETKFCAGYVESPNYECDIRTRREKAVSKWRREKIIGAGVSGTVWLEREEEGGQLRAVKCINQSPDQLLETSLSRELLALIKLANASASTHICTTLIKQQTVLTERVQHAHLFVEFFGWYENKLENITCFAMEYIEYGDLKKYIVEDPQRARAEAREVTKQILEGLEVLHREGICHRDLKPPNVLVASIDPIWVKMADFGTAKDTKNTSLWTRCGTPGYLAPEVLGILPQKFKVGKIFTYTLDMWSVGCILHELLTSEMPFIEAGHQSDMFSGMTMSDFTPQVDMGSLLEYCRDESEFPTEILRNAQVDEEGIDLIKTLMNPDPKGRSTAVLTLQHPWLASGKYESAWYKNLEREFSHLGINLDLGEKNGVWMRQLHKTDIVPYLPAAAGKHLPALLQMALAKRFNSVALMLLRSSSPELVPPRGKLLQEAVKNGRFSAVELLLANTTDVNAQVDGRTALRVAVERGDIKLVKLLLDNGADVNTKTDSGWTALQAATEGGHTDIVELLLSNGASRTVLGTAS